MDVVEMEKVGNVANNPNQITIQKHDLACVFIGITEVRLAVELFGVGDAWREVRR
jgi:hypothetical protein